jgi:hypothetical protein
MLRVLADVPDHVLEPSVAGEAMEDEVVAVAGSLAVLVFVGGTFGVAAGGSARSFPRPGRGCAASL